LFNASLQYLIQSSMAYVKYINNLICCCHYHYHH